jgi:cytochrome c5
MLFTHKVLLSTLALAGALSGLGLLSACGKKEEPAVPPAAVAVAAAPENVLGKSTFGKTCALCHAAGVAGAPKPGDKADWGPRIAQGNDLLYKHALEGFTGAKGMMPARGGSSALSDADVKAAVDYMVAQSK